jgi:hypothetical protein
MSEDTRPEWLRHEMQQREAQQWNGPRGFRLKASWPAWLRAELVRRGETK